MDYAGSLLGLTFISYMLYTCFQPLSQNLWSSSGLKLRDAFAVASAGVSSHPPLSNWVPPKHRFVTSKSLATLYNSISVSKPIP